MSWSSLLELLSMGCTCAKEALTINNRRFYVLSRLGEGGFSYVDLVQDARTRKSFALKRVVCHSFEDQQDAQKEAEHMRRFNHINLLPCEESDVIKIHDPRRTIVSEVLIVMPFHRRGTIQDEIERLSSKSEHIPEDRILRLLRGICEGLKSLHSHTPNPVAHRDVKPANVLLSDDDTPVLMDFGSIGPARVEIRTPSEGRALQDVAAERCTMPYRAPELFNVETHFTVDERIDVWSLGCTLYAMTYLEGPFDKDYQRGGSIALSVLGGIKHYPDTPRYSQGLKDLIGKMASINMVERPYIPQVLDMIESVAAKSENRI